MAHRIEVALRPGMTDAAGTRVAQRIREDLGLAVETVHTVEVSGLGTSGGDADDRWVELKGLLSAQP